jgi:site-specific DNA recombinase
MIAALYGRKSSDQVGAGVNSESVERQLAHARAYAASKGWSVADGHVYADDGISGAEFGDRRPGLARLLNALKPKPPFQVLIMSEESRLGRESIEVAYALKTFAQAGVRVFLYLEDRERTLDSPTEKLLMNVAAFADELERERARQRTYDAMARKARALHVTGGRVYGYENVDVAGPDGRRLHVVRRVNEEQAAVVRRIFTLCAEGQGFTRIAKALNEDGVTPPRRASGWAPTAVREILLRTLYRGEVVWNRQRKRDRWGVKKYLDRPEAEWLRIEAPALRIVAEDLWQAAHRRLDAARLVYAVGGRVSDRPDQEKYLLSGIATCTTCGGSLVAFTRDYKRGWGQRGRFYGCSFNHKRGAKVCANRILIRQDRLDRVVLDAIAEALDERLLERAVEKALQRLRRAPDRVKDRRAAVQAELPLLEARMRTLVNEIARGYATDTLRAELQAAEQRKRLLVTDLEALTGRPQAGVSLDVERMQRELRRHVAELRELLGKDIPRTRKILRRLLIGRLECEAFDEGKRVGYRFKAHGSYAPLLPAALSTPEMVTPAGFEPAISTLKGSRPGPG